MTRSEFDHCIILGIFPSEGNILLKALFHDAKGDWEAAHDIAQSHEDTLLHDRLHAYLHRKEGDDWNANYWYRRAKTTTPTIPFNEEWEQLMVLFMG